MRFPLSLFHEKVTIQRYRPNQRNMLMWVALLAIVALSSKLLSDPNQFTPVDDKLSEPPPENKQNWTHPMIFKPKPKIRLTQSSYQVTMFLDFAPYVNGFNKVKKYVEDYLKDLQNPAYFEGIKHVSTNTGPSPLLDDQDFVAFQSSYYCQCLPFASSTQLKIDWYLLEIEYLFNLFSATYCKFLNATDHIDFHPSNVATNGSLDHIKHTAWLNYNGYYHPSPSSLTPSEEKLVDCLLAVLEGMNPKLHAKLSRVKRFSFMTWILVWGVYSNSHSIRKINQNLRVLWD